MDGLPGPRPSDWQEGLQLIIASVVGLRADRAALMARAKRDRVNQGVLHGLLENVIFLTATLFDRDIG